MLNLVQAFRHVPMKRKVTENPYSSKHIKGSKN